MTPGEISDLSQLTFNLFHGLMSPSKGLFIDSQDSYASSHLRQATADLNVIMG